MTLAEALAYARAHQPSLQAARARVAAAGADTRIPRAQWLPGFGLTLQAFEGTANNSTASYVGVRGVDIPRIGGTAVHATGTWHPSTSTLGAIGGAQEIFDFGRIAAEAAVSDVAYEAEQHHADAERLRIELLVKDAYFAVQGAREVQRAAEEAFARARLHRDMAAAEVKSGLHAPIELTRAEADLTRFDVARIRAAGSLATTQAVFAAAVGVDDPTLDAAGEPPAAAPLPPLDQSLRASLERDPLLLEARTRVRGAEAITRALAAQLRPDLSLTATFSGRGSTAEPNAGPLLPDYGPAPVIANWDVGLVMRWPLYDPVIAARREAAATRADVARADVTALAQQETSAVQQAYVAVHVARAALVGLERAVDAARANYAQAEARFKAGLGTSLELADAEAVRTDVEIQLAVGRYDALRARAVLARLLAEDA
jgi:outer membrane protein TolC